MGQHESGKKPKKKIQLKYNWIPNDDDPVEAIYQALNPNVSSVLAKHGASFKIGFKEIIRNHLKV